MNDRGFNIYRNHVLQQYGSETLNLNYQHEIIKVINVTIPRPTCWLIALLSESITSFTC